MSDAEEEIVVLICMPAKSSMLGKVSEVAEGSVCIECPECGGEMFIAPTGLNLIREGDLSQGVKPGDVRVMCWDCAAREARLRRPDVDFGLMPPGLKEELKRNGYEDAEMAVAREVAKKLFEKAAGLDLPDVGH